MGRIEDLAVAGGRVGGRVRASFGCALGFLAPAAPTRPVLQGLPPLRPRPRGLRPLDPIGPKGLVL
ncbi:hypothetical protein, partial [Streptomyces sp. NPDC088357]|uniref:hypothetical protein n=1 Tax=Streptomyces sp. NPDC088357 TaxID=3154655 RepID=UPI0034195300